VEGGLWGIVSFDWKRTRRRTLEGLGAVKLAFHRALACFKQSKNKGEMAIWVARGPTTLVKITFSLYYLSCIVILITTFSLMCLYLIVQLSVYMYMKIYALLSFYFENPLLKRVKVLHSQLAHVYEFLFYQVNCS